MANNKSKTNFRQNFDLLGQLDSSFETAGEKAKAPAKAVKQVATELVDEFATEANGIIHETFTQLFGDLSPNEEFDLSKAKSHADAKSSEEVAKKPKIEAGIDYVSEILHGERKLQVESSRELQSKIHSILSELKQLVKSSNELQSQFKAITVESMPKNPGKYHESFFDWLLIVIKSLRIRLEDSANWLAVMGDKKKKKTYWNMFKKHGTQFGMSGERSVSNQVS